jgi:hypothetical protein
MKVETDINNSITVSLVGRDVIMYVGTFKTDIFSSPYQTQCELLPSLCVRRLSSNNFSYINLSPLKPLSQIKTRIDCGGHVC